MKTLSGSESAGIEELVPVWRDLASATTRIEFFESWLRLQCEAIPGSINGVAVVGTANTGPFAPVAFWPNQQGGAPRLAEIAEKALAERQAVLCALAPSAESTTHAGESHGLAFPIEFDAQLYGVVAIEVSERPESELQWVLQRLQWGSAWIEAYLRGEQQHESEATQERLITALDMVASVVEETRFDPACRSLVTELAIKLQCDRVSLGIVRRGHTEVVALSHSAQFGKRMNLIHAVGAAMDEAIDQKAVVRFPPDASDEMLVIRDHQHLATMNGIAAVLTVPMVGREDFVSALTFERPAGMPFLDSEVELCQSVSAVVARILEIEEINERSLFRRFLDSCKSQFGKLVGPRHVKRKLALAIAVLLVVFFSFATQVYRVTATATLEGAVRRTLAAPFDGYILNANVRAGDVTTAGAILATLDDQDLRLERLKWATQFAQYVKQHREAVANHDRAKAQIAEALYEQARAQVDLLDEQLTRATIKSPFDGVIVKGDLSQSLGSAVKRGDVLFEVTPLRSYRVILEVDEGEISDVASGRTGTLVLGSITDDTFPFTVKTITPVTTAREGRNYFRVEAILDHPTERLRPGMEGVGKIDVEPRKLIWIWTHKLVNWARLFLWTYLP